MRMILLMTRAFVIHLHTGYGPAHYDLMVEQEEALATWQLSGSPGELQPGDACPARRLPDHRKAYLTYEGPVSRGRGEVERIDRGTCQAIEAEEARWHIRLEGGRLVGEFELRQADGDDWTLSRLSQS